MKIQIVSDLHLEFGPLELPVEGADVLIAAGDIALGLEGFQWLEQFSIPVIYVAGNHEYWGQDLAGLTAALADRSGAGDIHFLENRAVVLDGVRFLGCTLWTDFNACDEAAMDELRFIMNDFRYVTRGGRLMRPDDLVELNLASRAWLAETLASPYEGKTVVVTHHAPLMRSWYYGRHGVVQYAYCNDLCELMRSGPVDLWVHGHVHESFDYEDCGVRVVCNPRGYHGHKEVQDFEPGKLIEL
jgi:3',5'-cyclic AMP phosphodiesterase CpdA